MMTVLVVKKDSKLINGLTSISALIVAQLALGTTVVIVTFVISKIVTSVAQIINVVSANLDFSNIVTGQISFVYRSVITTSI